MSFVMREYEMYELNLREKFGRKISNKMNLMRKRMIKMRKFGQGRIVGVQASKQTLEEWHSKTENEYGDGDGRWQQQNYAATKITKSLIGFCLCLCEFSQMESYKNSDKTY